MGGAGARVNDGWWWPALGVYVVLAAAWWPFNVVTAWGAWRLRLDEALRSAYLDAQSPVQLLVYAAFALCMAWRWRYRCRSNKTRKPRSPWWLLMLPVVVELGQTAMLGRHGQWLDLGLGVAAVGLGLRAGLIWPKRRELPWPPRRRWVRTALITASLTLTALLAAASVIAKQDAQLLGWDPTYELWLGDETTRDRPWAGTIHEAALDLASDRGVIQVRLQEYRPNPSQSEHIPRQISLDTPPGIDGLHRMSLHLTVTPTRTAQFGPARIVTWSQGHGHRNFTVGQQGDALVLRVRTAGNGRNGLVTASARWPGVFSAERMTRVVVTYADGVAILRIDDESPRRFVIHDAMRAMGGATRGRGWVFGVVMSLPLAVLAWAWCVAWRGGWVAWLLISAGPGLVAGVAAMSAVPGWGGFAGGWAAAGAVVGLFASRPGTRTA